MASGLSMPNVWCVQVLGAGMGQYAAMEQWKDSVGIQQLHWDGSHKERRGTTESYCPTIPQIP